MVEVVGLGGSQRLREEPGQAGTKEQPGRAAAEGREASSDCSGGGSGAEGKLPGGRSSVVKAAGWSLAPFGGEEEKQGGKGRTGWGKDSLALNRDKGKGGASLGQMSNRLGEK